MKTFNMAFKKILAAVFVVFSTLAFSQTETPEQRLTNLAQLNISDGVSLHIISPEPIQFVDLSTKNLTGDLPAANIARVKITDANTSDSTAIIKNIDKSKLGIITIVCQSFMAQYKVHYVTGEHENPVTNLQIQPEDMQPLEYPKIGFSNFELRQLALKLIEKRDEKRPIRKEKALKLTMQLNNVYVLNDYIFLDISFLNSSNLLFNIDGIKFSVEDKKIYKATNNQSIELNPVFKLNLQKEFKKSFRNIYVFKKFTYPNSKVLNIKLSEEQLSGRTIDMKVKYSDVLNADTF